MEIYFLWLNVYVSLNCINIGLENTYGLALVTMKIKGLIHNFIIQYNCIFHYIWWVFYVNINIFICLKKLRDMCVHFSKIAKVFFFYNGVEYYLFRVNDCACFDASRVVNISADCCITDIPIYETTDVKIMCNYIVLTMCSLLGCEGVKGKKDHGLIKKSFLIF